MSFNAQDLSVLAYANGFTHWHYRTRDALPDLLARPETLSAANDDGYFAAARDMLRPGDQITVNLITAEGSGLAMLVVTALPITGQPRLGLLSACQPAPSALIAAA